MVSSLIDQDTKWWKANVVRTLFLPFEANMILKIPLSQQLPEDSLIWIGNKRGVFTVKSAYHIAAKLQSDKDLGESSSGDSRSIIWKKLWKMKLPPKIKIFAWRACANSLPVYVKMAERGIQLCCDCPVCGEDFESLTHALIQCDFALSVWALWNDCPLLLLLNALDFTDIVLHFCSSPNGEHLDYFFATAWAIWHNRNQLVCKSGIWREVLFRTSMKPTISSVMRNMIRMWTGWPLRLDISKLMWMVCRHWMAMAPLV